MQPAPDAHLSYVRMAPGQRRATASGETATRSQLIVATQRLLAEGGVEAATSRAITDAAGANLAAVTYYFGSKQNLINEAMLSLARTLLEPILEVFGSDRDRVAKMLDAAAALNTIMSDHHHQAAAYVQTLAAAAGGATVRHDLADLLGEITDVLASEIHTQQTTGALPAWIAPRAMSQLILALAHGTVVGSMIYPERIHHTEIAAQFLQLLMAARPNTEGLSP